MAGQLEGTMPYHGALEPQVARGGLAAALGFGIVSTCPSNVSGDKRN